MTNPYDGNRELYMADYDLRTAKSRPLDERSQEEIAALAAAWSRQAAYCQWLLATADDVIKNARRRKAAKEQFKAGARDANQMFHTFDFSHRSTRGAPRMSESRHRCEDNGACTIYCPPVTKDAPRGAETPRGTTLGKERNMYTLARRKCRVEGCDRDARSRGWCPSHYKRFQMGRPVDSPLRPRHTSDTAPPCEAPDCDKPAVGGTYCRAHYERFVARPQRERAGFHDAPPVDEADEMWLAIPEFEGLYEASSQGRVRSLDRHDRNGSRHVGRILSPCVTQNYPLVVLSKDAKQHMRRVHALVAAAFHGPRPANAVVNHVNRNRADNRPENLEYITQRANSRHGREYTPALLPDG